MKRSRLRRLAASIPLAVWLLSGCGARGVLQSTPTPVVLQVLYPTPTLTGSEYFESAEDFFDQGQYELAALFFTYAVRNDPYLVKAYTRLGQSYENLGDGYSAIASYSLAIQLAPYLPINYYYRGHAYLRQGASAQAIADFRRFLELSDDPIVGAQVENLLLELEQVQP